MNPSKNLPSALRRLLLVPVAATLFSLAHAQSAPDAATLAKYDKNKNGRLDPDEIAAMQADQAKAAKTPIIADEAVELSPFKVSSDTKGYYASNTMSGTRFNTKLDDLASSISVVTKEQMSDFAMLDINDIFNYTGNTEGTGTYTDYSVDRNGSVSDNVQLNPTQANRIRGIAPANVSLDNIETMGRVPIDPLNIDAIEISRGPNANVFGLGNPSGTVNQVPAGANLSRDRSQAAFRSDSYGGYRTSLDLNRIIFSNKLAIRGSGAFQHDGFQLKPSGVDTVRLNGMLKYKPFKSTTISASVYYYRMNGNRPNSLPPRDNVTYWYNSGQPTWDPTTQQIHIAGATVGTFTSTTYNGPDYFSATLLGATHSQMFIDQHGLTYWAAPQGFTNTAVLAGATTAGPTSGGTADRYVQTTGTPGATGTAAKPSAQPLFTTTPTLNNRNIYDWSSINLAAPNRLMDRTLTSSVQLEQVFLNTQRQMLVVQGGVMREDSQRYQRNLIGIANDNGQSGQLEIDPNEKNIDGTPNPFFLRPFIGTDKPRTVWAPAKWDTYRAQLAYKLDLTQEPSLLKWLGVQQLTAYDEYKYRINRQYSFREGFLDQKTWIPTGTYIGTQAAPTGTPANQALSSDFLRYYVGDSTGYNVEYAPGEFKMGQYNYVWGNNVTGKFNSEPSTLGLVAADKSGGTLNTKQVIKTGGAVWQSHFLNDSLVTTFGLREDKVYSLFGNPNLANLNSDGTTFNYPLINSWTPGDYGFTSGKTTNVQYVVRPFRDLPFLSSIDGSGGAGHFFASALRGLSLNYNRSNSFIPATPAQDLFLNSLPNPTGEDKSYGLGLNLFDGKVVLRVTHYETAQLNNRNGDANTIAQRVIRTDLPLLGTTPAKFVLQAVAGSLTATTGPNSNQFGWIKATNPSWTDQQVTDELAKEMGMSTALQAALINPQPPIAATNDDLGRGTEVDLNVNLTRYWTVSANFSDTQTYIANVSSTLQKWIDQRMAIWTTIKDPTINPALEPAQLWWNHNYGGTQTAAQNFLVFVATPYSVIQQLQGQANPQTRRYNVKISSSLQLAGITDQRLLKKFTVGGALRWEAPGAIGYYGAQSLPATITTLNVKTPIYDQSHVFVDTFISYRTKLWSDKIAATFQFNSQNLTESGHLQPVGAFPDGSISTYRIVDPRKFVLSASFDL
jgi:hypothetical protein